ncbi:FimV family protein [Mariprofundus sp. NF]|uniref:type IV pilus assembly protein FimV n=1 Tax=Mariprofundus sp. NF TaxID=2608716 RepID=UPI0015A29387|nr:FimV/HubP family polar landmark protein [Mariprofundus sp. NF]
MIQVKHIFRLVCLAVALLMAGGAYAASLEKIEVNSRLSEPFFAEIPLTLDANELVSKLYVEIAAASDYKIFEVYRDPELSAIRADLESDARGVRVKLTSRTAIKAPFFNLIIKIRHGRVANFKKYPVFLEAPKTVVQAAEKPPVPTVHEVTPMDSSVTEQASVAATEVEAAPAVADVQYFEGWARTARYGPIVRGDMLSTVSQRLRVDQRYTMSQVMAALFEKNRSKFDKGNMNLLMKGRFLDVPTATEVESISAKDAYKLFTEHEKQWKELNRQPRYAAEAEVQRTRYSKRVRMGEQADGVAAAPVAVATAEIAEEKAADSGDGTTAQDGAESGIVDQQPALAVDESAAKAIAETTALLAELQKQNELLQQKLEQSEQSIAALSQKVDQAATAASDANVKRLEILMARMQGELEKAKAQTAAQQDAGAMDWVIWLLIALVVVLLIVVVLLMRREPAHPSAAVVEPEIEEKASVGEPQQATASLDIEPETAQQPPAETKQDEPVAETAAQKAVDAVEEESDLFDSIDNFPDELTDTDTAEMVPFDFGSMEDADPNVDYLSEADVYIRYGMEDEALQQLDLALRLNGDNSDAHIRKAELLFAKGDAGLFNQANIAALAALSGAGLAAYKTATSSFSALADEPVVVEASEADQLQGDDVEIGTTEEVESADGPTLDYDFSGLDDLDDDIAKAAAAAPEETGESQSADDNDFAEMDWLHDASFEDEVEGAATNEEDLAGQTIALTAADGETQMIDSILDDFEAAESTGISLADDEINSEQPLGLLPDDEGTLDLEAIGATQELDNLLNAFTEEGDEESPAETASDEASDSESLDFEQEVTATQHLDSLLGEFSDDDGMFDGEEEIIPATATESSEDEEQFGATQHLDVLMSEFSDSDEQMSGVDFEALTPAAVEEKGPAEGEEDPEATQQLDHLLSAFSSLEDETPEASEDPGATQQLDHLLGSFANQDDEPTASAVQRPASFATQESDSSVSSEDPGATQQLDHLLGEFSAFGDGESSEDDFEGLSFDKVDHLSEDTDEIEVDHCATQELDHLLSEFADDDDEDDKDKSA